MNKKRSVTRIARSLHLHKHKRAFYALGTFLVVAVVAIGGLQHHSAFVSPEVHFADVDPSGMQIVPASCPSNPGDADAPYGCDYAAGGVVGDSIPLCSDGITDAPNGIVADCGGGATTGTGGSLFATCVGSPNNIPAGGQVVWGAQVSGGTPPYERFVWSDNEGNSGDTGAVSNWGPISYSTPGRIQGNVIVVDSAGAQAPASCSVVVGSSASLCPNGSLAPNNDPSQCTCLQGNGNACSNNGSGTCPDGSAAPNNDASECSCSQGNFNACTFNSSCPPDYTGTFPDCSPLRGAPASCGISFNPGTIQKGQSATVSWSASNAGTAYDVDGAFPEPAQGSLVISPTQTATYSFLDTTSGAYCYASINVNAQCPLAGTACFSAANMCGETNTGVYGKGSSCPCSASAPPDSQCIPGISVIKALSVVPTLLQSGETTQVSWNIQNVSSCSVTGTNGDGAGQNATGSWTKDSDTESSSPIVGQTVYTLHCSPLQGAVNDDGSPAQPLSESAIVNIVPAFQEQ